MKGSMGKIMASIPVKNDRENEMNIGIVINPKGIAEVHFTDTALNLASNDAITRIYPNGGFFHNGKNDLWLSIYARRTEQMNNAYETDV